MNWGLKSAAIMILAVTFTASAFAGKHPVPLEPKQDPATCAQCHEDKTKGKNVHTAISMGCTSCHEIRVNREITRVKLTTSTTSALCVTCHADKKAADIKGKVHAPAVRDCVKCHDPHTSDNKNQLLKPTGGDTATTNLCLTCHSKGQEIPKGGSRHAALDMGCETCHITHKTGERGKREFDYHLTKDAPALCADCHDPKDAELAKKHQGQPFEKTDCLECHDPHLSRQPKLLLQFTHAVFGPGQCDSCHQPAKDGKVVLTTASSKELCLQCHSDKSDKIEKSKVQHPGAMGDCTDCHNPHAAATPGLPKPDPVNACLGCHPNQAEQHKKAHLHEPAFTQGCATCHEPHGGDNAHLLRAASPNKLCLECHSSDAAPQKIEAEHAVTIFNGHVKLPEGYFATVPVLSLKYGRGHPTDKHPVVDQLDEHDKVKTELNCLTCHQPHSSAKPNLLVKDQESNLQFCAACHKDSAK